jgi:hypothetical protein
LRKSLSIVQWGQEPLKRRKNRLFTQLGLVAALAFLYATTKYWLRPGPEPRNETTMLALHFLKNLD